MDLICRIGSEIDVIDVERIKGGLGEAIVPHRVGNSVHDDDFAGVRLLSGIDTQDEGSQRITPLVPPNDTGMGCGNHGQEINGHEGGRGSWTPNGVGFGPSFLDEPRHAGRRQHG